MRISAVPEVSRRVQQAYTCIITGCREGTWEGAEYGDVLPRTAACMHACMHSAVGQISAQHSLAATFLSRALEAPEHV